MKRRFKIAYGLRYPVVQHGCLGTTQALLKMRPGDWFILGCAKGAATLSVGSQLLLRPKWWAKLWPFFALWKSKTKAKQLSCKGISSAWLTKLAAWLGSQGQSKRRSASSVCNGLRLSSGRCASMTLFFGGHTTPCQRWLNKPPHNALANCASSTATLSRFMTPQIRRLSNGPKALKSGQRTKSPFAVGRFQPLKPLFAVAAFCANEQRQPPNAKLWERKKEDEHR